MGAWAIALGIWLLAGLYAELCRRRRLEPPRYRVRVRAGIRIATGVLLVVASVFTCLVLVAAAGLDLLKSALEMSDTLEESGLALAVLGAIYYAWLLVRSGDVVATERGLHFFYVSVPWEKVRDIRMDGASLLVLTPGLRRAWNSWMGRVSFSPLGWALTPDAGDRLMDAGQGRSGDAEH